MICRVGVRTTALHYAASEGATESLRQLLETDIDVTAQDINGHTALLLACSSVCNNTACVQLLLERLTPDADELVQCAFFAAGGGRLETLQLLVQDYSVSVQSQYQSWTLVHSAAAWHRLNCLGYLLSNGASAKHELDNSTDHKSALALALTEQTELPESLQIDLSRPMRHGEAAMQDRDAVVSLLLTHGAAFADELRDPDLSCVTDYAAKLRSELEQSKATLAVMHARMQQDDSAASHNAIAECSGTELSNGSIDGNNNATVKLQLVHAETGVRGSKLYSLDLALLAELHKTCGGEMPSVLLNLIQPPQGFSDASANSSSSDATGLTSSSTQSGAAPIQLLKYDGT